MSTTKGQNENGGVIIVSGDGDYETAAKRDYLKLLQTPSDTGLGANATGSSPSDSSQSSGSISGSVAESEKTETYKQVFWKHSKLLLNIFAIIFGSIIFVAVVWFIGFSNNLAANNAKMLTDIDNLKREIERVREDKNRDIDSLQKQLDRLIPNYSNPAPQPSQP